MNASRRRVSIGLVLATLLIVGMAPVVQAKPLDFQNSANAVNQGTATWPSSSCNGTDACLNLTGTVGENSCNGPSACESLTGTVGTGSCNNSISCRFFTGSIGNYSCNMSSTCEYLTQSIGNCSHNQDQPEPCVRADLYGMRSGGITVGSDAYNVPKVVNAKMFAGGVRRVYIWIQNDGMTFTNYNICECAHVGDLDGFSVRYFVGRTTEEITSDIQNDLFRTPTLAPGETYMIRARVTVSSASDRGQTGVYSIVARSDDNSTVTDTLAIRVARK